MPGLEVVREGKEAKGLNYVPEGIQADEREPVEAEPGAALEPAPWDLLGVPLVVAQEAVLGVAGVQEVELVLVVERELQGVALEAALEVEREH